MKEENLFGKPVQPFYRICIRLWTNSWSRVEHSGYIQKLGSRLGILYPNRKKKDLVISYLSYKCSVFLFMIMLAVLLSFIFFLKEKGSTGRVEQLSRDSYWGEEKVELLQVTGKDIGDQEVTVHVPEQRYSKEELPDILKSLVPLLEKTVLKGNKSLDEVRTDLDLVQTIPDTAVRVAWEMDSDIYIDYDGTLIPDAVTEEGAIVNITATLSYKDVSYVHNFAVNVMQPNLTPEEKFQEELRKEIEKKNKKSSTKKILQLPQKIQGKQVKFYRKMPQYAWKVLVGISMCAVLIFFIQDEKLQDYMEKRRRQMMVDYSEVVSKLTLFLGAGMTIRMALEKMASDYDKGLRNKQASQRFAYDEILYVCREMQGGVSEKTGLDLLGSRCQIPCYMKLCSLLSQNLKKGSKGMAEALSYEVAQAFEERKNIAKKAGEEAGTKLLFPMILMLVIVMVILIVPACLSF